MTPIPEQPIRQALANPTLQRAIYDSTARLMEKRRRSIPPALADDFQRWREQAHQIKKHTLEHLDYYLEKLEENVTRNGGRIIYARDAKTAIDFILKLARIKGVGRIVKSKSMTTEEIGLNEHLEHASLDVVETDLGEYILQLAHERPYHIVAPALHKTRYDVADIFSKTLGVERQEEIEKQTLIARRVLRQKFLSAGLGVTGANFLIAASGAVVLVENEGNARLTSSAPRIHVAVAGVEKIIPRAQDLAVFLKILGRSATGQPLTVYTSFLSGPRRKSETDGPEEFYLVLLDNGRTRLMHDPFKRQSLFCIRCGACLNHCPVYRKIGGHNYPWVYSGPIGAILSPQFHGLQQDSWLPYASSLCGACGEVCPVKIDIPKILLELRHEIVAEKQKQGSDRLERLAFQAWALAMRNPFLYSLGAFFAPKFFGASEQSWVQEPPGPLNLIGPLPRWTSQRDLPVPAPKPFRKLWQERLARRQSQDTSHD
jgi:L-lactate dehydrogenase complex protein LldF